MEAEESTGAHVTRKVRAQLAEELEKARKFAEPEPPPHKVPRSIVALLSFILTAATIGGGLAWNAGSTKESILARVEENGRRAAESGRLLEKIAEQIDSIRVDVQTQGRQLGVMNGDLGRLKDDLKKLDGAAVELERLKEDVEKLDKKTGNIEYYRTQYESAKVDLNRIEESLNEVKARLIALEKHHD